ncbi:signal peptidase I [Streptomyces vinaceus]|uniref:signal peptidase I n=1 Tax=Streptomyces vinaceus TaxID=1960 RepID=UPI0037F733B8
MAGGHVDDSSGGREGKAPSGEDGAGAGASRHRKAERRQRSFWLELPVLVVLAVVLALLVKTFLVQAFSIPSDSMQNTLQRGDRVLVDKLTPWFDSKPERGEVVVFHDPGNWLADEPARKPSLVQTVLGAIGLMPSADEKDLIKRVIAVGGDSVECQLGGPVKVNGKSLVEPYVYPGNTPCDDKPFGPLKVPPGMLWVMGDHRQDSADSRWHMHDAKNHGFVPVGDVIGRAFVVVWPVSRWATLPIPKTFEQPGIGNQVPSVNGVGGGPR